MLRPGRDLRSSTRPPSPTVQQVADAFLSDPSFFAACRDRQRRQRRRFGFTTRTQTRGGRSYFSICFCLTFSSLDFFSVWVDLIGVSSVIFLAGPTRPSAAPSPP